MSIQMVALKPCTYAGKKQAVGDEFTVTGQSDATLYTKLGWAAVATPKPVVVAPAEEKPKRTYARKVPEFQDTTPAEVTPEPEPVVKPKRSYFRRDMTAE